MPKFSPILGITVLCAVLAACQPSEPTATDAGGKPGNALASSPLPASQNASPVVNRLPLPIVNADNLSDAIRQGELAYSESRYEDANQNQPGALQWFLAVLRFDAENAEAKTGLENTLDALILIAGRADREGDLAVSERLLQIIESGSLANADTAILKAEHEHARQADSWYKKARVFETQSLVLPSKEGQTENAVAAYWNALAAFPEYQPARRAIDRLRTQREIAALRLAKQEKFEAALIALKQAELIDGKSPQYQSASARVLGRLNQLMQEQIVLGNLALDGMKIKTAETYYAQAQKILPMHPEVIALAGRIDDAKHYARFKPHQSFSDAWAMSSPAPEMVVIPHGSFEMGASPEVASASAVEKPRHTVRFERGFAIARNEITVGQFRQFIESSGYKTRASSRGWSMIFDEKGGSMTKRENIDWRHDHLGRPAKEDLPVVHVNLYDAEAYAKWLSGKTGFSYRLPSEAEFEYVLRAGKDTLYPWGNEAPASVVANLAGAGDKSTQSRSWGNAIEAYSDFYWGAAPVRSFPQETWGTYDASGNVEEWVQDCWHDSYQRAPGDGSAWVNPGCKMGVTRGASWASSLNEARVGFRAATLMKTHNARIGFRVVRAL